MATIQELQLRVSVESKPLKDLSKDFKVAGTAAEKAAKKAMISFEKLRKSLEATGKRMQALGRQLSLGVTVPIVAAGTASVVMAAQFESSMSKIVGLVGISQKQVQVWEKDLLRLGLALGKTPRELADGLFFITSAGLRGKKALLISQYWGL